MKKAKYIGLLGFLVVSVFMVQAQPPKGEAKVGDYYGTDIGPDNAIAIAKLPAQLPEKGKIETKVMAEVTAVCPKKGCWVKLAVDDSTIAFVKMKHYAYFVPMALKGKTVVLEGTAEMKTTSVAELRHYAEDAGKPQAAIDAITKPEKEIRLIASGIRVIK